MSVRSECFTVCKEIKGLRIREEVKKILESINLSHENEIGTKRDRSIFGHFARKQHCQFMGYLLVDHKRSEIEKKYPFSIPELQHSELQSIRTAHALVRYINTTAVEDLIKRSPYFSKSLNPYSLASYPDYTVNLDESININMLQGLITSIKESRVVSHLLSAPIEIVNRIPNDKYHEVVLEFINRIETMGVNISPEDFSKRNRFLAKPTTQEMLLDVFCSLMSLRKMLYNVNQLIYQAFYNEKLLFLTEENIINILNNTAHSVGKGLTVLSQPDIYSHTPELGEIIVIKIEHKDFQLNELCAVEAINSKFEFEDGHTDKLDLRVIDDDLNPYFSLI